MIKLVIPESLQDCVQTYCLAQLKLAQLGIRTQPRSLKKTRVGLDFVTIQNRILKLNYHVLQVRSWICGGQGSWFLISFSLGQVSLLWKFELNWMFGCWEKFVWWWWQSKIESLQVLWTLDFGLGLGLGLGLWQKLYLLLSLGSKQCEGEKVLVNTGQKF